MFVLPGGVQQYSVGLPERAYVLGENPLPVGSSSVVGDSLMANRLAKIINSSYHKRYGTRVNGNHGGQEKRIKTAKAGKK